MSGTSDAASLQDVIEQLRRENAILRQYRDASTHQRGRGPRDRFDSELVARLAAVIGENISFTAVEAFGRAMRDQELRQVSQDADVTTRRDLGKALGRLRGFDVRGYRLRRGKRANSGFEWSFERVSSNIQDEER